MVSSSVAEQTCTHLGPKFLFVEMSFPKPMLSSICILCQWFHSQQKGSLGRKAVFKVSLYCLIVMQVPVLKDSNFSGSGGL